jgi:hypothetical protein
MCRKKISGNISVDFKVTDEILIIYSALVKYVRNYANIMGQYISCLSNARYPKIPVGIIRNYRKQPYWILLTYLLTPWSRVLPEKLQRPELLKKFTAFYGTRRFITAFTRARHLSLS